MTQATNGTTQRALLENALSELRRLRAELAAQKQARNEPIAIVGMGCRFPGGANTPEAFWQLLRKGGDAVGEIPSERWDMEAYYDPDPDAPGKMYARTGAFLDAVDRFDARFFEIPPREAASLDPQQRLLLEVAWEALEHAGIAAERLQGSRTGVYVSLYWDDYSPLRLYAAPAELDAYRTLSNLRSMAAGRLAYVLGLQGPALQVDTACSSSLVAVHLACQALRNRECSLALAGGVNLILAPASMIGLSRMRALAPDGRCKSFDAKADGFGRGEGCGMVVLKRHADAVLDGDTVFALIRGSAVSNDGHSNGLTVPNGTAQEAAIREALDRAGVRPDQIHYVEALGTGTVVGDPIEVLALARVLANARAEPLLIGSVRSNVGHQESAAGVASLIKVALALHHKEIPPNLHFREPNPHIPWRDLPLIVPTAVMPWPVQPRRAGVNAFGMSGTNAHMILEEAPPAETRETTVPERPSHLLCLSAKSEAALRALAARHADFLMQAPAAPLGDIGFTAHTGRCHFPRRLALVAGSAVQLRERLTQFATGEQPEGFFQGRVSSRQRGKTAFLFPGREAQYVGMGRELYATQPGFRRMLDRCGEILRAYLERPLPEVLYPPSGEPPIDRSAYAQPALFALEVALAELWQSWGIAPDAVLGHGIGEYAAACVAGVFGVEEGLALTSARGRLTQDLPRDGADAFRRVAEAIAYAPPKLPLISSLSGQPAGDEVATSAYWVRHVHEPARFAEGLRTLQNLGTGIFLEIGPDPPLPDMGRQCPDLDEAAWLPSLKPGQSDWQVMLESLGELYVRGAPVDWQGFDRDYPRRKLVLPGYPWQRQRYWLDAPKAKPDGGVLGARLEPPLSGESPLETECGTAASAETSGWRERLALATAAERPARLTAYLRERVQAILGHGGEEPLDAGCTLNQLGLDSLMSLDLRRRVTRELAVALPVAAFLDTSIERLAAALASGWTATEAAVVIPPAPRNAPLPLSFMQEEVWRRSQSRDLQGVYNLLPRIKLVGELDVAALRRSLKALRERHEILRTTYPEVEGVPVQVIAPTAEMHLTVADLSALPEAAQAQEIERLAHEEEIRAFDLTQGPLLRATLLRLAAQSHLLLVAMHHILVDAWSVNLLCEDLAAQYARVVSGLEAAPPPALQHADYAHWQRQTLTPEVLAGRQAYWRELLTDLPPPLNLPTDRPRPPEQGERAHAAGSAPIGLPPELVRRLRQLSRGQDATLYMILLAAYAALLHRYGGSDDLVIGAPTSKRIHPELERMIGHFTGRSLLRIDLSGEPPFLELLARTRRVVLAALENQHLTLRQWLAATAGHIDWRPGRPLQVRANFNLLPPIYAENALPGVRMFMIPTEQQKFIVADITLNMWESETCNGPGLQGFWLYRKDLFEAGSIANMVCDFRRLLETVADYPERPIGRLPGDLPFKPGSLETRRAATW